MEWLVEVETRIKKNNQILFSKNNELIQKLDFFIRQYSHRTLVLWALDLAEGLSAYLNKNIQMNTILEV